MLAPKSTPVRYVRCRHSTPNGLTTINNARSNRSVDEGIVWDPLGLTKPDTRSVLD